MVRTGSSTSGTSTSGSDGDACSDYGGRGGGGGDGAAAAMGVTDVTSVNEGVRRVTAWSSRGEFGSWNRYAARKCREFRCVEKGIPRVHVSCAALQ